MQRVSLPPRLQKFLRLGLIGLGAMTAMSAVVNIVAAWQLIEPAEEQSLGITRNEFIVTYGVLLLAGATMIFFGLRWRK